MLISQLSFEYQSLLGTRTWVAGYYGDSSNTDIGAGLLVDTYIRLIANEQLPQHTYLALNGALPPADLDGKEIIVYGEIKDSATALNAYSVYPTPLITVEKFVVLNDVVPSPDWESKYSLILVSNKKLVSLPSVSDQDLVEGTKATNCDRALVISGGVDDFNNHARYAIDVQEKYKKLLELGFTDDQIDVLYYKGATSPVTVNGNNVVDNSATAQNITDALNKYIKEMPASCTLTIMVTDHGTGYDDVQGWEGARPALAGDGETGKTYAENKFKVDLRRKVYRSTPAFEVNGKMFFGARDATGKWNIYMSDGANWVLKGSNDNADDIVSETELGVDLNGDGNANNAGYGLSIQYLVDHLGQVRHNNNEWDTDRDGNADVRAVWNDPPGRYSFERKVGNDWKKMGEDTTGDFIIDGADGGVDWDLNGNKDGQVGFHEGINLLGTEVLWDDQLAAKLKPLSDKGIHIVVEMMQCFSGGFVNNLQGTVEKVVTACAEDKKSYSRSPEAGTYPGVKWVDTFELEFAKNLPGIDIESWDKAFEKAKEKDTARWQADGSQAVAKNDYQLWEKPVFSAPKAMFSENNGVYSINFHVPRNTPAAVFDFEIIFGLQQPRWTGAEVINLPEGLSKEDIPGGIRFYGTKALDLQPWLLKIKGQPGAQNLRIQLTDENHKPIGYLMVGQGVIPNSSDVLGAALDASCKLVAGGSGGTCQTELTMQCSANDLTPDHSAPIYMVEVYLNGKIYNRTRFMEDEPAGSVPKDQQVCSSWSKTYTQKMDCDEAAMVELRVTNKYGQVATVSKEVKCPGLPPVEEVLDGAIHGSSNLSGYSPNCSAFVYVNYMASVKQVDGASPIIRVEVDVNGENVARQSGLNNMEYAGSAQASVTPGAVCTLDLRIYNANGQCLTKSETVAVPVCPTPVPTPVPTVIFFAPCFAADTLVLMADGSTKAIADIEAGDLVKSYDVASGQVCVKEVITTGNGFAEYYYLVNGELKVTPPHPFFTVNRGWVKVEDLEVGDQVQGIDGVTVINSIERIEQGQAIYNITVADLGNFFVSADGQQFYLVNQGF